MAATKRSFRITSDATGNTIPIEISESPLISAENLTISTWGSSLILANLLHGFHDIANTLKNLPNDETLLPVLELGGGTSLVGLSAAAIWHTPVVLTDLAGIVPGLAQNIAINASLLASRGASARCGTLDWTQPAHIDLADVASGRLTGARISLAETKAQIILAADTIYDERHPQLLTDTITAWLAPGSNARMVLTYAVRVAYLDYLREIWELLEASGLECVDEGKEAGDGTFDDLAPYEWCVWRWKRFARGV